MIEEKLLLNVCGKISIAMIKQWHASISELAAENNIEGSWENLLIINSELIKMLVLNMIKTTASIVTKRLEMSEDKVEESKFTIRKEMYQQLIKDMDRCLDIKDSPT